MKIETKLSCGDKVWYFTTCPVEITVGQVRVEFTKSTGLVRGERFVGQILSSDNTLPKSAQYEERYMCIETGIGSGSIHEIGKTIWLTEADCLAGNAERIAERAATKAACEQCDYEQMKREEASLRMRLQIIEQLRATAPA